MESNFTYRTINPHIEEDFQNFLDIRKQLDIHLNKKVVTFTEEQIKWFRIRMGAIELLPKHQQQGEYALGLLKKPDEICIVCQDNDDVVGFVYVNTYNVKNGERTNDDVGVISDIFVKEKYRNSGIAFKLLQMGVDKLIEHGKFKALCNVQEDNKQRFLHFAMADGNVISIGECKRKDGSTTKDYTLLIDLKKLKNTTQKELGFKALKYKREYDAKQNLNF